MRTRAFVLFWGSTAASALLLGSIWSIKGRIGHPGSGAEDIVLLTIGGIGLCATFFVAARIAYVVGRVKKAHRAAPVAEG